MLRGTSWLCLCYLASLSLPARAEDSELRLYVLDCGSAELADAGLASDTGELDRQPRTLVDPCFLIHHPKGWLLWDAGLAPDTPSTPGFTVHAPRSLTAQLAQLGLTPDDIDVLAFSHMHFDHVGNASCSRALPGCSIAPSWPGRSTHRRT